MSEYNGWKNYETWNVSLWIGNDEGLYQEAKRARSYSRFVESMQSLSDEYGHTKSMFQTPDGVSWNDSSLDIEALDEMILDL